MDSPTLLNAPATADFLARSLPERDAPAWSQWLNNNRNPARRRGYHLPSTRIGGRVYYSQTDLDAFVDFERQRRLGSIKVSGRVAEVIQAFNLVPGRPGTGRDFRMSHATPQIDLHGVPFVQLVLTEPLTVYRVEVAEARALVQEVLDALKGLAHVAR